MVRHFGALSRDEVAPLMKACVNAAMKCAQEEGFGGLSQAQDFNVYRAIEDVIDDQWRKAVRVYHKIGVTNANEH